MFKVLKTFYKFVLKRKVRFIIFLAFALLAPFLKGILPYFYKLFVDAVVGNNFNSVYGILFAYITIRILSVIASSIKATLGDYLAIDTKADVRQKVVKKIHDLDFSFHSSKSSGSLLSAIKRGDAALFRLFDSIHHEILEVFVNLFILLYFFGKMNYTVSLIIICSFVVSVVVSKFLISLNIKTNRVYNKKEDGISSIIVDNMINFETVKLFAKEDHEMSKLKNAFTHWAKAFKHYIVTFQFLDLSNGLIMNLGIFFIILYSLKSLTTNEINIGDFVLILGLLDNFFSKFFGLIYAFRRIAKHYTDIEQYFGILDINIPIKDPKNPVKPKRVHGEIDFKNVWFSYEGDNQNALRGLNLNVRRGQSIAFVGRSGAGKTTIIKLLMRFYDVNKGSISVDGHNIKNFNKSDLRSFMGVVPQEPILFNNTIGYNIGYGKEKTTKKEIIAASKLARIHDFIDGLPKKYNTQVGERGIKLSGGQKQRVAIARMILSDPEIIIFDEATSQLDSESEKLIQEAFWKAREDKTTIIIAHRLSTIMRADKIVVLEDGKIAETGTHGELVRKKDSLYKHFWNLQLRD